MLTILELIQRTEPYFAKNAIENARLNVELLLAHVLGCTRMDLYLRFEEAIPEDKLTALRELVARRAKGVPLQHLLGTVEFHGREFLCDSRALIPRPETEELVEKVIDRLKITSAQPPARIWDCGTGSGVIAITLALNFPEATVTGTDLSPDALALARENAARHQLTDAQRLAFLEGDLFAPLQAGESEPPHFSAIVANLPYVTTQEIAEATREVREHDPHLALDGGADGLEVIRRFLTGAPGYLAPGGLLALELGHAQAGEVDQELNASGAFASVQIENDLSDIPRFAFATRHA